MKIIKHAGWLLRHPIYGAKWHLHLRRCNASRCDRGPTHLLMVQSRYDDEPRGGIRYCEHHAEVVANNLKADAPGLRVFIEATYEAVIEQLPVGDYRTGDN